MGESSGDEKAQGSLSNEDMPPEGSRVRRLAGDENGLEDDLNRKLTAREELTMRMQIIAGELELEEPDQLVRSIDSFFRGYENLDFLPAVSLVQLKAL